MNPPLKLVQERDFGQKINATFQFVVQNFKPLATCLLYIAVPFNLMLGLVGLYLSSRLTGLSDSSDFVKYFSSFSPLLFLTYLLSLVGFVITNLTVTSFIVEYEQGNRAITPADVWGRVQGSLLSGIGAFLLALLGIFVGFIFLFIPGYFLAFCFPFIFIVIVRENADAFGALKRSVDLVESPWWSPVVGSILLIWLLFFESVRQQIRSWWSTFVLLMMMVLIVYIVSMALAVPGMILGFASGMKLGTFNMSTTYVILTIVSNVFSTLVQSLIPIAAAMQYYNFIAQKTELADAIDEIGKEITPRQDLREEDF